MSKFEYTSKLESESYLPPSTVKPPLTATSLQLRFFGADSPYIHSCFHLSTTAIFFGGQSIHSLLFPPLYNSHFFGGQSIYSLVSTSLQWLLSSVPKVAAVERFNCAFDFGNVGDENVRAKEGGKETTSVPFPWSLAVYHQSIVSRSPLACEKRSA